MCWMDWMQQEIKILKWGPIRWICMSLVWIAKPFVLLIEAEAIFRRLPQFIWTMKLIQDHLARQNFTLTRPLNVINTSLLWWHHGSLLTMILFHFKFKAKTMRRQKKKNILYLMASASNSFWGGFLFLFLFSRESYKFTNHNSRLINTLFNDITPNNIVETLYISKTEITNINKLRL